MLCKLALRNVRRRLRDYSVYFLTLALGVCLFYTFNALEGQSVMVYLSDTKNPMVEGILTIMNVFSVFVSAILAGLILYADAFMMKRRKKELAANYAGEAEETERRLTAVLNQPSFSEGFGLRLDSRLITYADTMGSKALVIFLGLYLGITFLLSSAAVLALQQLSQAADNAARYDLLARLGVDRAMADRSVFVQVALAFLLPLALALVHSLVGMTAANDVIAQAGKVDAWAGILAAAGLLTAVYGAYFLGTCLGCRRISAGK